MSEHENLMNLAASLEHALDAAVWLCDHTDDDEARAVADSRHITALVEVCRAAAACLSERLVDALTLNPETNHG
ncbi:MAG: hypothetical protein EOM92_11225 [Gammaproteobacteria bacterium]|nr:hypothetical protein [Gammaproteobacteria bacterium]